MAIIDDVTIYYITEHGIQPDSILVQAEETFENYLPELTADGYSFIGWYTSPTFEEDTKIDKNDIIHFDHKKYGEITLYAKWLKNAVSVNSKMTALANEVRELSGTSGKLGLDAMTTQLGDVNDEVSSQVALLAQAVAALNGKTAGSGDGVTLPAINNPASASDILSGKQAIDGFGNVLTGSIPTKISSDLTASGATVTVPSGYYASQATKSVATATQASPSISIDSAGKITASATQTAGYVSAGTKTGTKQLTTQAAKTITPSKSSQTAVAKNVYTTGAVTVAAIPSTYVQPSYTKDATTYTPTTANQTISAGTYLTGAQTIKGDSNLIAGNIKSGITIFGITGTLTEGSGGGGTADNYEDELLDGTIVNYTNNTVSRLRQAAFMYATSLKTVNLPACSAIGQSAFVGCTLLNTASFETCTAVGSSAFQNCTALKTISFPACVSVSWAGFSTCTSLTAADLPNCTYLGGRAFQGCTKLKDVNLPKCRYIYSSTFQSCKSITTLNLPEISMIGSTAFGSCTALSSLYMTGSRLCTLSGSNAFTATKITSTSGAIYVPASMLTSYQEATNWTYFSNRMVGV